MYFFILLHMVSLIYFLWGSDALQFAWRGCNAQSALEIGDLLDEL